MQSDTDLSAITLAFAGYVLLMLIIGIGAYRATHNLSDYILGGRRLGRWVTALSASASDMSGWLLLGLPGYAYAAGLEAGWIALGLFVGTWLNWRWVAPRLREQTEALDDALTVPAYLGNRFPEYHTLLRVIAATFILIFFTFYTSSGLVAGGKLFEAVFAIPYPDAVLSAAAVILLYTFLGGFLAVSWTDVVQGLMMVLALIVVPVIVIRDSGGWQAAVDQMEAHNPHLLTLFTGVDGAALGPVAILSLLAWGLGYFGQPHILARFMAIARPAELTAARRIALGWVLLCLVGALLVGWSAIGYLTTPLAGADTERVFMELVALVFHPWVAGILLAAILAAIMSTADSQLLVASSALAEDFYSTLARGPVSPTRRMWLGRSAVAVIAVIASALAMAPDSKVLELVAYAWAGFGAVFGPVILFALYRPQLHGRAAVGGMLAGGLTVILWKQFSGGIFDLYEIVPGILAATLTILVLDRLAPRPS